MTSYPTADKTFRKKIEPWFLAARPKTLSTCIIPVVVPTFLAHSLGYDSKWWLALFSFLGALCIQVATNLVNDALDYKKGADTDQRIGPMRVTQSGLLSSNQVLFGGMLFFLLAFFLGVPLIFHSGWIIGIILSICILCGYLYTGGPFPLSYVGLGDLFVLLFYGFVFTCTVYYIQTGVLDRYILVASLQCGLLSTVLIAINNLRDIEEDAVTGKSTLAVRFGKTFGRIEITFLLIFPFLLNIFWMNASFEKAAFLPLLLIPIALKLARAIWKNEPSRLYNKFLGLASLLNLLFGILLSLGLYLQ
jgi:1,4-dihydroxy-2-naphthoate polyprenyltransferase